MARLRKPKNNWAVIFWWKPKTRMKRLPSRPGFRPLGMAPLRCDRSRFAGKWRKRRNSLLAWESLSIFEVLVRLTSRRQYHAISATYLPLGGGDGQDSTRRLERHVRGVRQVHAGNHQ